MVRIKDNVTISGTDVTACRIKWKEVETQGDEIPQLDIQFESGVLAVTDVENGKAIVVKRGETLGTEEFVFIGVIDTVKKNGPFINVMARNSLVELVNRNINTSFDFNIDTEAGVASEIVKTMINDNTDLIADNTSVVSTGTVVILEKFTAKNTDIFERVSAIKDPYGYQLYFNYDTSRVVFEPKGFPTNANVLEVGQNVTKIPTWDFDGTQIVNKVRVEGAEQIVETTEDGQIGVTTGYTTTSVLLEKQPVTTKVFVDASSPPTTLKTGGNIDSTSIFDYSVDVERRLIVWNTAQFTPGGSDFVSTQYGYPEPRPITRQRIDSITSFGLKETTKHFGDIETVEDAITRAEIYLDLYSQPFVRVKLQVPSIAITYKAGEKVQVVDATNGENRELVIIRHIKSFPHKFDVLECGDKEYHIAEYNRLTLDRLKRIEEELAKNQDLIIQILDFDRVVKPKRRYFKISDRTKIFDSFILGHRVNGLLGQGQVLDAFETGSAANWSAGASVAISDNAVTFIQGTGSMEVIFSGTGSRTVSTTQVFGDLSTETGVASGAPSQGTVGLWWSSPNTTGITAITLRIGSSASDYVEMTGREYRTVDGYSNFGSLIFGLVTGFNYYLFDLNTGVVVGTPDWTNVDFARVEWTVFATHTGFLDYFTISQSNLIGLNGLGDRSQSVATDPKVVQGSNIYKERVYDTDFLDASGTTATFNTGTQTISFTAGQLFLSSVFDRGGSAFTRVTVTLGDTTGTLLIEVSFDNKSTFQTVTDGVQAVIASNDGTGAFIRITENAAGAASITNTTDTFGQITTSAIEVLMEAL